MFFDMFLHFSLINTICYNQIHSNENKNCDLGNNVKSRGRNDG